MLDAEIDGSVREEVPPRGRRRRVPVLLSGVALLAIGTAGTLYALRGGERTPAPASSALPTAPVLRRDMIHTADVDGTLGYAGTYTVLAGGGGRITWLPRAGDVIRRGARVYGVNGHGVPLFYGATPFWRSLRAGMSTGYDVLELERNLSALGYGDGVTVDRTFTPATAAAVRKWQDDVGVAETGVVRPGDVVVQPRAIRVTDVKAVRGAPATGTVLTAGGTERRITVSLPVSEQGVARKGARVRVTLPGGRTTTGRVSSIGKVAKAGSTNAQSQTGQGTETATVTVQVTLDRDGDAGGFDSAPATVGFTSTEHRNVLTVPVNALLASAAGRYSVNVVDASGATRSVPVRLGIFDGDRVEVAGDLAEGMKVQVPRS